MYNSGSKHAPCLMEEHLVITLGHLQILFLGTVMVGMVDVFTD